jgi:hypothetical protein
LKEAKRRLQEELRVKSRANAAYEDYRVNGRASDGKRLGKSPTPYSPPEVPQGKMNLTDPDSRLLKATRGYLQGYNAQAAVNEEQIVIAAEVTVDPGDFGHLEPIVDAASEELEQAGVRDTPGVLLADAGYWHQVQMQNIVNRGIQVLIPPDASKRKGTRPGWNGGAYAPHETSALHRARRRALQKTESHDRAGVRTHEVQPPHRPLPTPRKIRCASRVATYHRDPQPVEAPQAPDGGRRGLRGASARPIGPIRFTAAKTTTPVTARNPRRTPALSSGGGFAKQPRGNAQSVRLFSGGAAQRIILTRR